MQILLTKTDNSNNRYTSDTQLPYLDNFFSTKTEPNTDTLKNEDTKIDAILKTVHDDLMIIQVVNLMISNYPTNIKASEGKFLNILNKLIQNKHCRKLYIF